MLRRLFDRTRTSLRLRLLVTTLVLLALSLTLAVFAFERVARSIVTEAVHSHLGSRAKEIQDSLVRFNRTREGSFAVSEQLGFDEALREL